jgi:hypothetical protein
MNSIGGYFDLELCKGEHYHANALRLNTARNCLEYILQAKKYKKIYLPYYTCEVLLEPLRKCNVTYEFYPIDESLEPIRLFKLAKDETFLYTNYFGLKQEVVTKLSQCYGKQLIVDNAQAFFAPAVKDIDTFYSARKFFGVADGAYLYTNEVLDRELEQDLSYSRMTHLLKRADLSAEAGFQDFHHADSALIGNPIRKMSKITDAILASINYSTIISKRKANYEQLHKSLADSNQLHLKLDNNAVPLAYPYLSDNIFLRQKLAENRIYTPTYWPNVLTWCNATSLEYHLAQQIIPLPIDQRYGQEEMNNIIDNIIKS